MPAKSCVCPKLHSLLEPAGHGRSMVPEPSGPRPDSGCPGELLHTSASVSSPVAFSSERFVQLVSEALTTFPSSPPPLQKQTPKGLLFEAKAISGQHCGERGLQAILEQPGVALRVGPPGLQPSQNTAHGFRGLPPPFTSILLSPSSTARPGRSPGIDREQTAGSLLSPKPEELTRQM